MAFDIAINSKLEIYNLNDEKIGDTRVQDIEPGYIYMSVPYENGIPMSMAEGKKFKVVFYGKKQKVFEFDSEIVDRKKDKIVLYKIKEPNMITQIQRRKSVRIPIVIEVFYSEVDEIDEKSSLNHIKDENMKACYSIDLSSSGAGLVIKDDIDTEKHLLLSMKIDDKIINVLGKTVRVDKQKRRGEEQVKVGIEFEELKYSTEEKLTNFIFNEMRKQIKNR